MLTILSIAIGIVLVLLLVSILSSTVHDIISLMLSLRGKHLKSTLGNMLGEMQEGFVTHPFFNQLRQAEHKKSWFSHYSLPTWIKKETFTAILSDRIKELEGNTMAEKIEKLPDNELKEVLKFLARESDGTVGGLKTQMENWFDQVMERASDYYGRGTKWRLFFIGLGLAALLNADTIHIYHALSKSPELREKMEMVARNVSEAEKLPSVQADSNLVQYLKNTKGFMGEQLGELQSPLGLGWNQPGQATSFPDWAVKLLGFIITGIAVTFGASFWFELLKKILSIKDKLTGGSNDTDVNFAQRRSFNMPQGEDAEPIGDFTQNPKSETK